MHEAKLADAMHNHAYSRDVALDLTGTNKADATVTATVSPADSGITAAVADDNGTLHLEGTPAKAGDVTVTLKATAPGETAGTTEAVEATVSLNVSQEYQLAVEGSFQPIRVSQSFNDGNYTDSVKVFVVDEAGTKTSLNAWSSNDYKLTYELDPAIKGVGLNAVNAGGSYTLGLTGTPEEAKFSHLKLTLTYHGATITDTSVPVKVYEENVALKDALAGITGQPESWDMEPYEMTTAGKAVIPTWLHHIYGSHESGLYGQIGNAKDPANSDTITIPAGADVEFVNVKINSSVKIVVEKGAKLTLTDSVAYGDVEVNGGTVTFTQPKLNADGKYEIGKSALVGTLTLNDGSTLADSYVDSNADWLTDGRYAEIPESAVVANGTVTFTGANHIESAEGQTALTVNGTVKIPAGATLEAVSTTMSTINTDGGNAVRLNKGTITGDGTLKAQGGSSDFAGQNPGKAVVGTGEITVKGFEATGGSAGSIFGTKLNGADAGEKGVVLYRDLVDGYTIAGGKGINGGTDGIGLNSFTIKDGEPEPTPDPDPEPNPDPTPNPNPDPEPNPNPNPNPTPTDPDKKPTDGKQPGDTKKPAADTGAGKKTGKKSVLPQTSDDTAAAVAAVAAAGAVALAAGAIAKRRAR